MPPKRGKTPGKVVTRRDIKEVVGRRNRRRNKIRRDPESSEGEKFAGMSLDLKYYEKNEKEAENEYNVETSFGFKEPSRHDIKALTYDELKDIITRNVEKRIGIVGPAGSGKTTLLERLERDLSQLDKLVLFQTFRDLGNEEKITPQKLFFDDLFHDENDQKQCYEWIRKNQENIIFVLDGLDQAGWSLKRGENHVFGNRVSSTSDIISSILSKKLFSDIKVVYSSREHAVSSLEGELRPDYVISITGLSHDDAKDLFVRKIGENGEDLWNKMEVSLKPLLSIPAFLDFTIEVYEADQENPPTTLTEIMKRLFLKFVRSEYRRAELTKVEITGLQKLSYNGMKEGRLTFKEDDFKDVKLDWNQMKDFFIVVPCPGETNYRLFDGDKVAIFPHQTIQEFFAGGHVVHMNIDDFKKTVKEDLASDYWSVVTRIVTGLLLNKKVQRIRPEDAKISDLREKQEILKEMLKSKYGDGEAFVGRVASLLSVLSSIVESGDGAFIQSCVKSISLHNHSIGTTGISSIASAISHCKHLDTLCLRNCGIDAEGARLIWESIKNSALTVVNHLDVSANIQLGEGFQYICKLASHCNVKELNAQDCNLQSKQLKWLEEIKLSQLDKLLLCGASPIAIPFLSSTTGDYEWQTENNVNCQADIEENLTISDASFESIGKILANQGGLSLSYFFTTPSGLRKFEQTLNEKKIVLSKLNFRFTGLNAESCKIVGRIVKQCKISELMMHACKVNSVTLGCLLETVKGTKIINLDFAGNKFDVNCCEVIANIVTQCSVEKLNLAACNITNKALDQFLITVKGIKLSKLDVSGNYLTPSAIMRINESISVEELVHCDQNKRKLVSHGSTDLDDVDNEIRQILSQPITKVEEMGPGEGAIDLLGCTLSLPPGANQMQRRAKISVSSSYEDAPEGYIVASPEINCDTSRIQGFATISLQLHAIPDDGQVEIISKRDDNSDWKIADVHPILIERKVSFQVDHFSPFKAVLRSAPGFKIHLCRYIFFCPSTSELRSLTCIDNDALKRDCIGTLECEGFKLCPEQLDNIVLCDNEEVIYKYRSKTPEGFTLEPDTEVVTRNGIITHKQKLFKLLPCPEQNISIIEVECLRTTSGGDRTSVLTLERRTPEVVGAVVHEEPMVINEFGNPVTVVTPVPRAGITQGQEEPGPSFRRPVENMEITMSTKDFYDLHRNAEDVYPIDRTPRKGRVLIINNKFLGQDNERSGSEVDLKNLKDLWEGMGFIVDIKENLTADTMWDTCKEFAQNTRNVSIITVIIMSHGGRRGGHEYVTGEDGSEVFSDKIITLFSSNNCQHLRGIPKVFMFQACRGFGEDHVGPVVQKDADQDAQRTHSRDPERADMLLVYPSQSGCFAYRHEDGSRLMKSVVNVLKRHAHDTHILDMLTKVNREVAPEEGRERDIQGSNHVSHLRKKLFLFPGWPR